MADDHLPPDILQLHTAFGSSPSASPLLPWPQLAPPDLPIASCVRGLAHAMENGGQLAIMAADAYLGMMLAPDCPLYSLFSELAFNALLRCIRCSCKAVLVPDSEAQDAAAAPERPRKGKGGRGRRKQAAGKQIELDDDADFGSESFPGSQQSTTGAGPSLQDICQLLARLQMTLRILHLKEYQESVKNLLELLVELPHLVSEMQGEEDAARGSRAARVRRTALECSRSALSAGRLSFDLMKTILHADHGEPMITAVILLKLLAPSILLTRAGGSSHQRSQIREQALHFVTVEIKSLRNHALRSAVVALPRYIAMKAPEKTDPRAHAVEAVMAVVKAMGLQDQRKFAHFVAKLSRGKPRHRLFAVDLVVSLLGSVPNPFGVDKDAEQDEEEVDPGMSDDPMDCSGHDAMNEENRIGIEEENGKAAAKESKQTWQIPEDTPSSSTKIWWGTACLEALLHRCSDKVPTIRARALANLAQALELLSNDIRNRAILQNLLGFGSMPSASTKEQEFSIRKSAILNAWQTPGRESPILGGQTPSPEPSVAGPGASPLSPGAGHGDLGSLLRRRCLDDKVAVRKSTLFLMMKSASLLGKSPDEAMLEAMGSACADPMVSIRKAALGALSEMMRKFPADTKIVTEWFQSALPLALDHESTIQDECLSLFEELILDRIASVAALRLPGCLPKSSGRNMKDEVLTKRNSEQLERQLPPGILVLLRGIADDSAVTTCVKRVCTALGRKKRLRAGMILALQNIITASRALWCSQYQGSASLQGWTAPKGAWFLVAEVSAFVPKAVSWDFLRNHWRLLEKQESVSLKSLTPGTDKSDMVQSAAWAEDRVYLLQTISNVAIELPPDAAANLAAEMLERLEGFDMNPTEVGAHVKALNTLCNRKAASADEGEKLVRTWVEELLEKAGQILDGYVSMCSRPDQHHTKNSFQTPKPRGSSKNGAAVTQEKGKTPDSMSDPHRVIGAIFTVGALVLVCPTAKVESLVALLQDLLASINSRLSHEGTVCEHEDIARGIYAQAWVTLGKICLANHELAKRFIPLFLQELEKTDSAAVRNNIMVAMTDFCIKYTSLVDGYVDKLTKALRDPCELVRRQGFVLLAQLLQRDYLKWRGSMFHRFLLALVDESDKICHMANFLFGSILKTKAPLLAYNSFVETIFVLNDCHAHAGHSEMLQTSESDRKLFSLRGNAELVVEKRMRIYSCLLKQMAPVHIVATSAKLCADVLAAAADGLLDLNDPNAQSVLQDSLKILASKEMRIGENRGTAVGDNLEVEEEGAAAFAAVKGRVVTQLAKRNLVQNAIPIFIELKRLLESKNSPLTGSLMECMRVMLKDYKNEMEELLFADKQLQKEIMYDMQKHEAAKAKAKVVAAATVVASPQQWKSITRDEAEKSTTACRTAGNSVAELPKKISVTDKEKERRRRYADGKENMIMQGKSFGSVHPVDASKSSSFKHLSKRKPFLSPGVPQSASRVKWLDQTPQFQGRDASTSRTPVSIAVTLRAQSGNNPQFGGDGVSEEMGRMVLISPTARAKSQEQNMASAVGDVVAEATAAAVLNEVARGTPTPLHAISLPKLQATVPSTVKKASFQSEKGDDAALGGLAHVEAMVTFESVRRRQSFSSIDVILDMAVDKPC